jgi:hypothetical protein
VEIWLLEYGEDEEQGGERVSRAFATKLAAQDALKTRLAGLGADYGDAPPADHGVIQTEECDLSWSISRLAVEE